MSSELHKQIDLTKEKEIKQNQTLKSPVVWKIGDRSNIDQLKAVTGICFMLGALILMGLYSNLL